MAVYWYGYHGGEEGGYGGGIATPGGVRRRHPDAGVPEVAGEHRGQRARADAAAAADSEGVLPRQPQLRDGGARREGGAGAGEPAGRVPALDQGHAVEHKRQGRGGVPGVRAGEQGHRPPGRPSSTRWGPQSHPVRLVPYDPDFLDESVLWTESRDVGNGFRCVRMVNNIYLKLDALHGDKWHGGVRDGTEIVLFWKWCEDDNQRWKIQPYST